MEIGVLVLTLEGFVGVVVLKIEPVAGGLLEAILDKLNDTIVRTGLWASFGSFRSL